jgi:probable HAF family extracellular repeat protein
MKPKNLSQRQKRFLSAALAITLLLLTGLGNAARTAHARFYTIEDMGTLGSSTRAYGINNSGQVVGYSFTPAGPSSFAHAFRFTDGTGLFDLNPFTNASISYGAGINNLGQVSGSMDRSGGAGGYHAFRYTDGIGLVDLGSLPGYLFSYGGRINDRGQVIGSATGSPTIQNALRAFLYTDGRGMKDLGTLGGNSTAQGINNFGWVVGDSVVASTPDNDYWNPGHAFLYTNVTGMLDLNNLIYGSSGWELHRASDINDRGQIVGFGEHSGIGLHAFRYTLGIVKDLGTFPNGGISYAIAINNRGDVVGAAYLDASGIGNFRAMLYTDRLGIQNLNDLIDPSLGWVLREATGINERGQICGWGEMNGEEHAFRLTPLAGLHSAE